MSIATAGELISDAAVEIGLDPVTDVYASIDKNIIQLRQLLKSLGRELVHERAWNYLRKERVFTTTQGVSTYALPADFHNMIDQTGWNRTNRLPLGGPLSPQEWQYLKSRLAGVVWNVLFRPMQGVLTLYPDSNTPGGQDIAYEYQSEWWVKGTIYGWAGSTAYAKDDVASNGGNVYVCTTAGTSGLTGPTGTSFSITDGTAVWEYVTTEALCLSTSDKPTTNDDLILFDPLLVTKGLKFKFLAAKGFDTTVAQQDYYATLDKVKGHDAPSPILSATKSNMGWLRDPFIGQQSIPVTDFGS